MKKLSSIFVFLIFFICNCYGSSNTYNIILNSYTNVSSITVNDSINLSVNNSPVCVDNVTGYTITKMDDSYYRQSESFTSYLSCRERANTIPDSFCVYSKGLWYVGTVSGGSKITSNTYSVKLLVNNKNYIVIDDFTLFINPSSSNYVKLGSGYRGQIKITRNNSGLSAVNVIDCDEYLYSVVPSEMPYSWNIEALKAQAVCARNYTYTMKGKHSNADLCDGTHCQVYTGIAGEKDSTTKAVNETKNKYMYYNGKISNSYYFSSSGGYTASAKDVWGTDFPYLKAVDDRYESGARVWTRNFTFTQLSNADKSLGTVTNVYISQKDSLSGRVNELTIVGTNSTKVLKNEEVRTYFSKIDGSLDSRNFTISNNITGQSNPSSAINNTSTVQVISKSNISTQNLDGLYVVGKGGTKIKLNSNVSVYSNKVTTVSTSSARDNYIILSGKGWGHGVGMSQYGANSMAEKGYKYDEILKHYFTGVEIY